MNTLDIRKNWSSSDKDNQSTKLIIVRRNLELINEAKELSADSEISFNEALEILRAA